MADTTAQVIRRGRDRLMAAENKEPVSGQDEAGLIMLGEGEGTGWRQDPDGPHTDDLLQGKREVQADAVVPVPGSPGDYYVVFGDQYARITPVISFVTHTPPGGPEASPQTRSGEQRQQVVFVQPPSY
ncbi:hypothetical protein ACFY4K_02835 [Streptomyces leeuwenhoekii]|uniref:hypothetical protein n=1 Tax=Streptomyces leeuwenhoekii TaxID=1437453 RepID=UPI00368B8223